MGTLFIMWSCEFFGRRANIQFGSFFSMFGGALQSGANSLEYGRHLFQHEIAQTYHAKLNQTGCSKPVDSSAVSELAFW